MKIFKIIGILIFLGSCNGNYYDIDKGENLNFNLLKKTEQILVSDIGLGLVINIEEERAHFDYHIYFFDKNMQLTSVLDLPANSVDSFINNTIYISSLSRKHRWSRVSTNELPAGYLLKEVNSKRVSKSLRISNKMIDSIRLVRKNHVKIYYKESSDLFQGFKKEAVDRDYKKSGSKVVPIYKLNIDAISNTVTIESFSDQERLRDRMLCSKPELEGFLKKIQNSFY